jgi:hypothetical protein
MINYSEIEDVKELRRLSRTLAAKLRVTFPHRERRTIGSPGGNFSATVRFARSDGESVFWWAERPHKKKGVNKNLFGHGKPGSHSSLSMDVQFNVPVVRFSRRSGGSFLWHEPTKRVVLAHRGLVTIGHGRVAKDLLFEELHATRREATTSDGSDEFLLIGELEGPTIVNDIEDFAIQIRGILQSSRPDGKMPGRLLEKNGNWARIKQFARLRSYFAEFSGKRAVKGTSSAIADCYHGNVVQAIRKGFDTSVRFQKSREVDLTVAINNERAFLFEVKTSNDTQSIYTAVGQLFIHSAAVKRDLRAKRLTRVLVLPELPSRELLEILTQGLRIVVLFFARSSRGRITIKEFDKLRK